MKIFRKTMLLLLCTVILLPMIASCSKPPELETIRGRLSELIEASAEINEIFFGNGLPTYERVTDPRTSTKVYRDEKNGKNIYYYELTDETLGRIVAYRDSFLSDFSYLRILKEEDSSAEAVYRDEENRIYAYAISYTEKTYDFYYSDNDPTDYDYVRADCPYYSVQSIKDAAEKVYSTGYLNSLYETLFIGSASVEIDGTALEGQTARYIDYTDSDGNVMLVKSNTYKPLIDSKRCFDLDSARIVKPANGEFITVSIDSWLESSPEARQTVKLTLVLQNGVWMLDSGTY